VSIRVLIVDDEQLVRSGFRAILEAQHDITVVGEADDGASAIEAVNRLSPDVVLMDIRMRRIDGLEATRTLTARNPKPPKVVVLTTFDYDEYVYQALKAGASAFLLKDSPQEQLVAAVRIVMAGDALLHPSITRRLIEDFAARPTPTFGIPRELSELSERELEVMRHVAKGLSNAEIAAKLYLARDTVKSHVGHILTKLRLRDRTQAVVMAYETGLIQPGRE
jgi:DNA-binding NarL/FixJ family response regulator